MTTEQKDRKLWATVYKALKQVQSALGLVMAAIAERYELDGTGELKTNNQKQLAPSIAN